MKLYVLSAMYLTAELRTALWRAMMTLQWNSLVDQVSDQYLTRPAEEPEDEEEVAEHKATFLENPCGGGAEYLHREPASRKRRRNGTKKGRAIA
jgi:hypothetical protein